MGVDAALAVTGQGRGGKALCRLEGSVAVAEQDGDLLVAGDGDDIELAVTVDVVNDGGDGVVAGDRDR